MYKRLSILLTFACPVLFGTTAGLAETQPFAISGEVEVTHVVDGDSLRSGSLKIRLHGIDAPERKQLCKTDSGDDWPCGSAATSAMTEIVGTTPRLVCSLVDVDRYGRLIMRCHAGGTDISEALVSRGLALAYRRYSTDYVPAEEAAAGERRGMWQGRFDAPWDWRKRN